QGPEAHDDEQRVRDHLYGSRRIAQRTLDPGPVDIVATEEPGAEAAMVAAAYFGVSGAMSAFTIAFQVPNLVRSLFADAAIQAAFVPVFTEHLQRGEKREAFRLASTLIFLVTLVLTGITAFFVLIAPYLMPLFVGSDVPQHLTV